MATEVRSDIGSSDKAGGIHVEAKNIGLHFQISTVKEAGGPRNMSRTISQLVLISQCLNNVVYVIRNTTMEFDVNKLDVAVCNKMMTNLIMPRPIAWITSVDAQGVVNAAPFSYFNLLGAEPPVLAVGIGYRPGTTIPKDTALNIRTTGEFVVNVVSEELVEKMNECSVDFPRGVSELEKVGLTSAPCRQILTPRIAESPVNFECRLAQHSVIGGNLIFIGYIVHLWIADELVDPQTMHIRAELFHPVGRMGSPATYVRSRDRFNMPRMNYQMWREKHEVPSFRQIEK